MILSLMRARSLSSQLQTKVGVDVLSLVLVSLGGLVTFDQSLLKSVQGCRFPKKGNT
jgi:hypothetical protein